jgi:hypothetical protein
MDGDSQAMEEAEGEREEGRVVPQFRFHPQGDVHRVDTAHRALANTGRDQLGVLHFQNTTSTLV